MITTAFITRFLKSATPETVLRQALAFGLGVAMACAGQMVLATEVTQLKMERSEEAVYLTAAIQFDLPPVVEDALLKGIPMFFVAEADIYRDSLVIPVPAVAVDVGLSHKKHRDAFEQGVFNDRG